MSICQICQGRAERPCTYSERTKEYYDVMMPALRHVAYRCGYALAVHGSLKTDIDLLAAPWRDSAISAGSLAEEIRLTAERIIGTARVRMGDEYQPAKKDCGRLAWSFYLQPEGIDGPYIDLSVMPKSQSASEPEREFLAASIAVWRELDAASPDATYVGQPLPIHDMNNDLRVRERTAWLAYRATLA